MLDSAQRKNFILSGSPTGREECAAASTENGVVYVLRRFPEISETFVRREIEGLAQAGIPVSVLAVEPGGPGGATEPAPPGVPLVHLARFGSRRRPAVRRGAGLDPGSWLRFSSAVVRDVASLRSRPRHVARCIWLAGLALRGSRHVPAGTRRLHAHFANDAAALARYVSILSGLPYTVTAHAYDLYLDPFLLAPNLASADRVLTVSRANLDFLRSIGPGQRWSFDRFSVLRCGVDLARLPYRDPPPPRSPARLLCVARLIPKKGHRQLLAAVSELVSTGTPMRLELVGAGPLDEELQAEAESRGLGGRVQFSGPRPWPIVRARMEEADVLVLASRVAEDGDRDGLPVALVEACALGLPVVSTEVSGIPELVAPDCGHLAPPDRPDLLARALRSALTEAQASRVARARRARKRVEEEFDLAGQIAVLSSF